MREQYSHSGAIPILGLLMTLGSGFLAAFVLGFVYTYFQVWVPFIYLNFFATLAFGGGIGLAVGWTAQAGHVRNNLFVNVAALLFAAVGIYVEWGVTPMALIDSEIGLAGFDPFMIMATVQALYEHGSWGVVGEDNVSGIVLAIIWLIEIGVIFFSAWVGASIFAATRPYCEYCRVWTDTTEGVNYLHVPDPATGALIANGDFSVLDSLTSAQGTLSHFLRLDMSTCPQCDRSNFMTVNLIELTNDSDGNTSESVTALADNYTIEAEEIETFSNCGQEAAT